MKHRLKEKNIGYVVLSDTYCIFHYFFCHTRTLKLLLVLACIRPSIFKMISLQICSCNNKRRITCNKINTYGELSFLGEHAFMSYILKVYNTSWIKSQFPPKKNPHLIHIQTQFLNLNTAYFYYRVIFLTAL
ncbi:hypothetical protein MANES_03G076166v8 [Manihot esculenta]|uniref:Uncharacterized protein n=1 Tax=Manihot esculenta TaxID=3983 RepID=A0ACB7HZE6_MANES|nr:hypothetical protein MANES_03G076166v8 [Manihot esculenta]